MTKRRKNNKKIIKQKKFERLALTGPRWVDHRTHLLSRSCPLWLLSNQRHKKWELRSWIVVGKLCKLLAYYTHLGLLKLLSNKITTRVGQKAEAFVLSCMDIKLINFTACWFESKPACNPNVVLCNGLQAELYNLVFSQYQLSALHCVSFLQQNQALSTVKPATVFKGRVVFQKLSKS